MNRYILPTMTHFGGDQWKILVAISIEADLQQLKRSDLARYIKTLILAAQKALRQKSAATSYTALEFQAQYSRNRIDPDFWNEGQRMTVEHIGSDEAIKLILTDQKDYTYIVQEPVLLTEPLCPEMLAFIEITTIEADDLAIITDEDD